MITEATREAVRQRGDVVRRAITGAIADHWEVHGYAPAVRDIQTLCGISSTSVVAHHLDALERDGVIARSPLVSRSIRLVDR